VACPKLEAARKLYAGSGIMLNLADCYEHLGKTASAWATFGQAAERAAQLGRDDDEAEAKKRKSALDAKLCRLSIRVLKETPGLVLKRNGVVVDAATLGSPLPVDPGLHSLVADAPGYASWSSSQQITEPGKTVFVEVPGLTKASSPPIEPDARAQ